MMKKSKIKPHGSRKKVSTKELSVKKHKIRQFNTFVRMVRYGINSFTRNAWLTLAATAMMTLTLFVILLTLVSRNILQDSVQQIKNKIDMSIYVKSEIKDEAKDSILKDLKRTSNVKRVTYINPSNARKEFAKNNVDNQGVLKALNLAKGGFPGTYRIVLNDMSDTSSLEDFVKNNKTYKRYADRKPSFKTDRLEAVESINRWIGFAEKSGILISIILASISILVVFNTIRMAIYNRKEEIKMMKLIGAEKSFIRGPFFVEAIVYGFLAAVISTFGVIGAVHLSKNKLQSYDIVVDSTMNILLSYIGFVLLGMILLGAIIGVVSSFLATRKYLKI